MGKVYCPDYDASLEEVSVSTAKDELRKRLLRKEIYRDADEYGELRIQFDSNIDDGFAFVVSGSVETAKFIVYKNRRIKRAEA